MVRIPPRATVIFVFVDIPKVPLYRGCCSGGDRYTILKLILCLPNAERVRMYEGISDPCLLRMVTQSQLQ